MINSRRKGRANAIVEGKRSIGLVARETPTGAYSDGSCAERFASVPYDVFLGRPRPSHPLRSANRVGWERMRKIVKATVINIAAKVRKIMSGNLTAATRLYGLVQEAGFHVASGPEPRVALLRSFGISCVLDVGANRGQFGRSLRLAGYHGKIVSFEPVNKPYQQLTEIAKHDDQWSAVQLALGDRDEKGTIHVSSSSVFSSLLTQTKYCIDNYPTEAKVTADQVVTVKRLDDVFRDYVGVGDEVLLKIDTQGFERAVLDGARAVLSEIRGVQLEISFKALYEGESTAVDMIERLSADGFTLILLEPVLHRHMLESRKVAQADALFLRLQ